MPVAMATPDGPRDDLIKYLRELERRLAIVEQRSPLANTGMSVPGPDQVDVSGTLQSTAFDGNLSTGDAGTTGWAMNDTAAAFGSLYLRPGSVSNAALTNPVIGQNGRASAANFALTTSFAILASTTLTVPAGCTQLIAVAGALVYALNPNTTGGSGAGGDYLYAAVSIGNQSSNARPFGVSGSNGSATASGADAFTFSGLTPGSTLQLAVQGCTNFQSIPASTNNNCSAWAMLIWLR